MSHTRNYDENLYDRHEERPFNVPPDFIRVRGHQSFSRVGFDVFGQQMPMPDWALNLVVLGFIDGSDSATMSRPHMVWEGPKADIYIWHDYSLEGISRYALDTNKEDKSDVKYYANAVELTEALVTFIDEGNTNESNNAG